MNYKRQIEPYYKQYGDAAYPILYQADVRTRLEQMGRVRRDLEAEHTEAVAEAAKRGTEIVSDFDPVRSGTPSSRPCWRKLFGGTAISRGRHSYI